MTSRVAPPSIRGLDRPSRELRSCRSRATGKMRRVRHDVACSSRNGRRQRSIPRLFSVLDAPAPRFRRRPRRAGLPTHSTAHPFCECRSPRCKHCHRNLAASRSGNERATIICLCGASRLSTLWCRSGKTRAMPDGGCAIRGGAARGSGVAARLCPSAVTHQSGKDRGRLCRDRSLHRSPPHGARPVQLGSMSDDRRR